MEIDKNLSLINKLRRTKAYEQGETILSPVDFYLSRGKTAANCLGFPRGDDEGLLRSTSSAVIARQMLCSGTRQFAPPLP